MVDILVATDLSARSDQAVERAATIARERSARLTVVHVADDSLPPSIREALMAAAEVAIRSSLAKVRHARDIEVAVRVAEGNPYKVILAIAEETGSEMIVVGRHRTESCDAAFGGTTSGRIARMSRRPVLVVTDRAAGPYRRAIVGVDFSAHSRLALRNALAVAPTAELHLVHAFDMPFAGFSPGEAARCELGAEHGRELAAFVEAEIERLPARRGAPPKVATIVRQGEVESVLRDEINRIRPDLLVVGTHGRGAIARAILGSVAQDLLAQPPCDLMVVRDSGESGATTSC